MVLNDVTEFVRNGASIKQEKGCKGTPITRIETISNSRFNYDRLGYADIFDDKYQDYYLQDNDVLLSHINSEKYLGRSVVYKQRTDENIIHGMNLLCLRFLKNRYNPSYFCYYSQSDIARMYISRNTKKSVNQASITATAIKNMPIPTSSIEEQKNVVYHLDSVQSIIDLYNEQMKKLDELIKSRFVEMFGDINNNNSFSYKPIKSITTVLSGGTPNRKNDNYWKDGTIPWVKTTELNNSVIYSTEEKITELGLFESSAKIVPSQTILIAMYGQGKTRGMTGILGIEACTNQACACILPDRKINQKYLWYYYIFSYDKLRSLAKGGNQPNLNVDIIKNYPVLFPPLNLQNQFADFVSIVEKQKANVQKSIEKLETLKKSLMQEYFG